MSNKNGWDKKYSEIFLNYIDVSKPKILVTLSWDVSNEKSIGATLKVMNETQNRFEWLIRLHPSMLSEKQVVLNMLAAHNISRYELEVTSELPLYAVLSHSDLHITHSSSTVIEASYFGVKSIITSEYGWTALSEQVDHHYINKAITDNEIISCIEMIVIDKSENFSQTYNEELTTKLIGEVIKTFKN